MYLLPSWYTTYIDMHIHVHIHPCMHVNAYVHKYQYIYIYITYIYVTSIVWMLIPENDLTVILMIYYLHRYGYRRTYTLVCACGYIWRVLFQNTLSANPEKWACQANAKFKDCDLVKSFSHMYICIYICTYLWRALFQNMISELGIGSVLSMFWIGA